MAGKSYDELLAEYRESIPEMDPGQVEETLGNESDVTVVDVRESDEYRAGHLPGAVQLSRGFLEMQAAKKLPDQDARIIAYCAGGVRSLFAANSLRVLGYTNVTSMKGGFTRWKQNGHPVDVPEALSDQERERYARHLSIDEVGEAGQLLMKKAKVLCIGAGGLGSPAAFYLAAAGIGTLGIVD